MTADSGKRLPLAGKVALITGASGGIGSTTARHLASLGAQVILAARRAETLDTLAREIATRGGVATAIPTDMTDREQVARLAERAIAASGRVDALIHGAGIGSPRAFARTSPEEIIGELEINLVGAILLTRALLPGMLERRQGTIISISSVAGHVGIEPLYSTTKFGLRGFSYALRRQVRGSGVAVCVMSPGFIRTPMTRGIHIPMPGPQGVARRIARLITRPKREVITPSVYRIALWAERWAPWLVDLAIPRER